MKRFLILSFVFLFASFSHQAQAQTVMRGCDSNFYSIQENFGKSMIVRDQAMARQIIKRNDSALAMACFDKLMVTASRAGDIFSDVEPSGQPAYNAAIATGLGDYTSLFPTQTALLAAQINGVVEGTVDNLMAGFQNSLSQAIGGTNSSSFGSDVSGVTSIGAVLGISTTGCDRLHQVWTTMMSAGIESDAVYARLNDLFASSVPGAGTIMAQEITTDTAILGASQTDATNLDTPGSYSSFRTIPAFTPTSTVAAIIGAM